MQPVPRRPDYKPTDMRKLGCGVLIGICAFMGCTIPLTLKSSSENKQEVSEYKEPPKTKEEIAIEKRNQELISKYGTPPTPSAWNGNALELGKYFRRNLKDPDSLDVIESSNIFIYNGKYWAQRVIYRAKNSFGGFVVADQIFCFRDGEVVDVIDLSE